MTIDTPTPRFLRYSDLRERGIRWSRKHIHDLEREAKFPKRVRIGENSIAWIESEIDGYIAERIAARAP